MKHNDYSIVRRCDFCGKPIFAPISWTTYNYVIPRYPTCLHSKPSKIEKAKKELTIP